MPIETPERFKEFVDAMAVFGLKSHQEVLLYIKELEKTKFTLKDTQEYVDYIKEQVAVSNRLIKSYTYTVACPDCGENMFIYPVNFSYSTQTGDPTDKSVWMCKNKACLTCVYNKEDINTIFKRGIGKQRIKELDRETKGGY